MRRRQFLSRLAAAAAASPVLGLLGRAVGAPLAGQARNVIIFYYPDGIPGKSQDGEGSLWTPSASGGNVVLSPVLEGLGDGKKDCVFVNGLTMGPTDSGSHPGGAKKLLTGVDGGNGISVDRYLAGTLGAGSPHPMLYLGVQANVNNASGDKHISYVSAGVTVTPQDNPLAAYASLFGGSAPAAGAPVGPDPNDVSVIDGVLDDMVALRSQLGDIEKARLDLHLEALWEVEKRIKTPPEPISATCEDPSIAMPFGASELYLPERFPDLLRAQIDLAVEAVACGLTRVVTIQASHHTSELIMSRFPGTPLFEPTFDMRSHQASHYGSKHDWNKKEFSSYVKQRQWWVSQFGYLLDALRSRPDGEGTLLDNSLVLLCSEVSDGNTHLHDDMPFVLAGRAGGRLATGRVLDYPGVRHSGLLGSIANAAGQPITCFGQDCAGLLPGLLT